MKYLVIDLELKLIVAKFLTNFNAAEYADHMCIKLKQPNRFVVIEERQ